MYQPTPQQQLVLLAMLHNSAEFPGKVGYTFHYANEQIVFYPRHFIAERGKWVTYDVGRVDPQGKVFHRDETIVHELEQIVEEAPWEPRPAF